MQSMTPHNQISPAVHVTAAAKSDIGRVRRRNEDAFLIADLSSGTRIVDDRGVARIAAGEKGVLLVVSDGMGGQKAGEVASALVVEGLARALASAPTGSPPSSRLKHAAAIAHLDVAAAARQAGREGMGATLTAVYISGSSAYIAEVGDSRAYLLRGGSIHQLTRDQNVAQLLMDAGALKPEDAPGSPTRNVLTQAMGNKSALQVALGRLSLRDRDCLMLCSDGLTGAVTDEEIRAAVMGSKTLDAACDRLVALANERGGVDNITIVIAGVGGALPGAAMNERVSSTFEILESFGSPPHAMAPPSSRIAPASVKMVP
jgi:serine/threonine protein phosphatase PrpC